MFQVRLHLGIRVWHGVGDVDLITRVHECIVETHCPEAALLLRVQVVDLLLVGRGLVSYILTHVLDPAALALLQVSVGLGRPN